MDLPIVEKRGCSLYFKKNEKGGFGHSRELTVDDQESPLVVKPQVYPRYVPTGGQILLHSIYKEAQSQWPYLRMLIEIKVLGANVNHGQ